MELPTFSLIVETENLANADIKGLAKSLASLANQEVSPTQAKEVFLLDSGDTPPALLKQLKQDYPWITVYPVPEEVNYYQAKMLGAKAATGEVIVYGDSDCIYETTWLNNLLTTFNHNPYLKVVAGKTMTRGVGIYGTAMALAYIFPPFSGETQLRETQQYFLNNVAFRRAFLLQHPIPTQLPLYRGNCVMHARQIRAEGETIYRQPLARATHAPPSGLNHFLWRFLLIGHDLYCQKQLLSQTDEKLEELELKVKRIESMETPGNYNPGKSSFVDKLQVFRSRVGKMVANEPRHLMFLPFAIPVVIIAVTLILTGYLITSWKSNYLLKRYYNAP